MNEQEVREEPYAAIVRTDCNNQVCASCFTSCTKSLKCCSRCKFVHYCNSHCQKADWGMHKWECKCILRFQPVLQDERVENDWKGGFSNVYDMVRLMARMIWTTRDNQSKSKIPKFRTYEQLMSHDEDIVKDEPHDKTLKMVCAMLKVYLGDAHIIPDQPELIQIFGKMETNCFSINASSNTSEHSNPIGRGLYLRLSVLDHSCDPDAWVSFDGSAAILRPLKPGLSFQDLSKITISYIDVSESKLERKRLLSKYYFECKCSRCI